MEAYKFATTVLEHGIIRIPELKNYADQRVEVFIVIKPEKHFDEKSKSMDSFLKDWSGFFSKVNNDDVRYNYLMEKYK